MSEQGIILLAAFVFFVAFAALFAWGIVSGSSSLALFGLVVTAAVGLGSMLFLRGRR